MLLAAALSDSLALAELEAAEPPEPPELEASEPELEFEPEPPVGRPAVGRGPLPRAVVLPDVATVAIVFPPRILVVLSPAIAVKDVNPAVPL